MSAQDFPGWGIQESDFGVSVHLEKRSVLGETMRMVELNTRFLINPIQSKRRNRFVVELRYISIYLSLLRYKRSAPKQARYGGCQQLSLVGSRG